MKNTDPLDGWRGLRQSLRYDASAGFVVFLLALPLSLGIARASEFPALMGLVTAMVGGILVSFFSGSPLSIKGPAAGLIVIAVGAVQDFGGGETGWRLALGTIAVAGAVQILFGLLKLGRWVDFFPLSTVHGMLAAIGIIILLKQIPVLLDLPPALSKGKSPLELIALIPFALQHLDPKATLVGVISLWIMVQWNSGAPGFLKKIPAPLVVLAFAIPAEMLLNFQETEPGYALLSIGNLWENLGFNVDFGGLEMPVTFGKYVLMFALVGSIESLLTVKATDLMDPWHRKSNTNQDLIAVGIGNIVAPVLGGLPMISEVARSSANISNGAQTRWANFFHGLFLLLFLLLGTRVLNLIPNTALAAMLISVGIKLAHPRQFVHIFQIGKDQLAVFLITILVTLLSDLLLGISAGIALKLLLHVSYGAPVRSLFIPNYSVSFHGNRYRVDVSDLAVFTNFIGLKSQLEAIPSAMNIEIDLSKTRMVDSSVMEGLYQFQQSYSRSGGQVSILGLDEHTAFSSHTMATRKKKGNT